MKKEIVFWKIILSSILGGILILVLTFIDELQEMVYYCVSYFAEIFNSFLGFEMIYGVEFLITGFPLFFVICIIFNVLSISIMGILFLLYPGHLAFALNQMED